MSLKIPGQFKVVSPKTGLIQIEFANQKQSGQLQDCTGQNDKTKQCFQGQFTLMCGGREESIYIAYYIDIIYTQYQYPAHTHKCRLDSCNKELLNIL